MEEDTAEIWKSMGTHIFISTKGGRKEEKERRRCGGGFNEGTEGP